MTRSEQTFIRIIIEYLTSKQEYSQLGELSFWFNVRGRTTRIQKNTRRMDSMGRRHLAQRITTTTTLPRPRRPLLPPRSRTPPSVRCIEHMARAQAMQYDKCIHGTAVHWGTFS